MDINGIPEQLLIYQAVLCDHLWVTSTGMIHAKELPVEAILECNRPYRCTVLLCMSDHAIAGPKIVIMNYHVYMYDKVHIYHHISMILQEAQSLCFLKALQDIHLGQPWITFPSPFCVADVGR